MQAVIGVGTRNLQNSIQKGLDAYRVSHKEPLPHEWVREIKQWGSYGKDGQGPLTYIYIKDLGDEHILNIINHIKEVGHPANDMLDILDNEITWRMGNPFKKLR